MLDNDMNENQEEVFVNLDLERQLLRYITLRDFSISMKISKDVFYGQAEKIIYDTICKLQSHFPEETLKELILEKVKESDYDLIDLALDEIVCAPDLSNFKAAEVVLNSLQTIKNQRELRDAGYQIIGLSQSGHVEEAFKIIKSVISKDTNRIEQGDYIEDFEQRYNLIEKREQISDERQDIIKTGIQQFDEAAGGLMKGEVGIVVGRTGGGKAQPLWSKVMMPDGYKLMRDVKVGDNILTPDGKANIIQVHPQGVKKIYKITMSDGTFTHCTKDHLWHTETWHERNIQKDRKYKYIRTLEDIMKTMKAKGGQTNHSVPYAIAQYNEKYLIIDPYIMGVLLGDGNLSNAIEFVSYDDEIVNRVSESITGVNKLVKRKRKHHYGIGTGKGGHRNPNPYITELRNLGLYKCKSKSKFIPDKYLYNSIENRIALLQGLFDTDGTLDYERGSKAEFDSISIALAEGVRQLVRSLGGRASISKKKAYYTHPIKGRVKCEDMYRVIINLPNDINPFYLSRKKYNYFHNIKYKRQYIKSIDYIGDYECKCITIDSLNGLYLTDNCIITHNSIAKLNFACAAWLFGYNVIHVGLEMTKMENQFRLDTLLTQIPATVFRLAKLTKVNKEHWKDTIEKMKNERENYIEFIGGKALTMDEIFAIVEGVESKRGLIDLMILDHIVLVKREGKQDHMKHWENFQDLSDWAKMRNKAIWTSTQSTDEGIKNKKGMGVTDIKYSRAIVELAQIAIAIYQTEIDQLSGDLNFKVIKGRGIKAGDKLILRPDFTNMVLDSMSFYSLGLNQMENK